MKKTDYPKQVRMDEEMYRRAMLAAKKVGLNFSAYVRNLIAKDLNG